MSAVLYKQSAWTVWYILYQEFIPESWFRSERFDMVAKNSNFRFYTIVGLVVLLAFSEETSFSFTFNDTHGFWFMENGTHEIRVELIDNDFDVPNDALSSSIAS